MRHTQMYQILLVLYEIDLQKTRILVIVTFAWIRSRPRFVTGQGSVLWFWAPVISFDL